MPSISSVIQVIVIRVCARYGDEDGGPELVQSLIQAKIEAGQCRDHPDFPKAAALSLVSSFESSEGCDPRSCGYKAMKQYKVFDEECEISESEDAAEDGHEHAADDDLTRSCRKFF